MNEQDDDMEWLEALAGRPQAGTDPETLREAAIVRQAMLALAERRQAEVPTPQMSVEPLLARLRSEGRLSAPAAPKRQTLSAWLVSSWQGRAGFAMAATVLIVAMIGHEPLEPHPAHVTRGGTAPQTIVAVDPTSAGKQLAEKLRATGVDVDESRFEDVYTIRFRWPEEPTNEQAALFAASGLKGTPGLNAMIEIRTQK